MSRRKDCWSLSCKITRTSTTTSALPSICFPPLAGGEPIRGPLGRGECQPSTSSTSSTAQRPGTIGRQVRRCRVPARPIPALARPPTALPAADLEAKSAERPTSITCSTSGAIVTKSMRTSPTGPPPAAQEHRYRRRHEGLDHLLRRVPLDSILWPRRLTQTGVVATPSRTPLPRRSSARSTRRLRSSVPRGASFTVMPLAGFLSPWSCVVWCFSQCHRDGHPLVAKPLTEPSLSPPQCGARHVFNIHDATLELFSKVTLHRKRLAEHGLSCCSCCSCFSCCSCCSCCCLRHC